MTTLRDRLSPSIVSDLPARTTNRAPYLRNGSAFGHIGLVAVRVGDIDASDPIALGHGSPPSRRSGGAPCSPDGAQRNPGIFPALRFAPCGLRIFRRRDLGNDCLDRGFRIARLHDRAAD